MLKKDSKITQCSCCFCSIDINMPIRALHEQGLQRWRNSGWGYSSPLFPFCILLSYIFRSNPPPTHTLFRVLHSTVLEKIFCFIARNFKCETILDIGEFRVVHRRLPPPTLFWLFIEVTSSNAEVFWQHFSPIPGSISAWCQCLYTMNITSVVWYSSSMYSQI